MTDHSSNTTDRGTTQSHPGSAHPPKSESEAPPAPVLSGAPDRELELKLKKNPDCDDAKVDVGSDQSMDASDPVSATIPGGSEPVPSSGFPEGK